MTLFDFTPDERRLGCVPRTSALENGFPAVLLSRVGEHESWRKEVHRPATSTHKWWAKRLGSVFRGILTAAVTEDEAAALMAYRSATRLNGLTVFDPFAGSGTTLVEAVKLGACVVGWDINPVATLVQRQALQRWDTSELERAYKLVEGQCRNEIDRVHRTESGETVLYYFWVAATACPVCCIETRLFSTQVFSQHVYPKRLPAAHVVCPTCLDVMPGRYDFDELTCRNGHRFKRQGAATGRTMTCPNGHESNILDVLAGEVPRFEMYAKLVLGADGSKRYEPITSFDRALYEESSTLLHRYREKLVLPLGNLEDGENTRQALRWGFANWQQFFNDRQLYSLGLLGSAIRDLAATDPEREALAALFSGTLEFNNMFCSFKGEGTGAVRHMFSHHILKPERTPLEAHPWGTPASSGSFSTLFQSRLLRAQSYKLSPSDQVMHSDSVVRVRELSLPIEATVVGSWPKTGLKANAVYLRTGDSSCTDLPEGSIDLIVTDPPYMDNVHYSELADFFHAWLRPLMPFESYPGYASDQDRATTRNPGEVQSASPEIFEEAITRVWRECTRVLRDDGLLAFTFHQARLAGWAGLVRALAKSNLVVTAVQPIKGEMTTSITKNGAEPSNLDAVVVCRKRTSVPSGSLSDPTAAADMGERRLIALSTSGIDVGAGDIRSVIRGHVLATYTTDPDGTDLRSLCVLADELAADCVARLSGSRPG